MVFDVQMSLWVWRPCGAEYSPGLLAMLALFRTGNWIDVDISISMVNP